MTIDDTIQQQQQEKPQIITHLIKPLTFTPYTTKWIPNSAKFIVAGQTPRGTGKIELYELTGGTTEKILDLELDQAVKCSTLGTMTQTQKQFSIGDFKGGLKVLDLDNKYGKCIYNIENAHEQIINCIDGCGGSLSPYGPPELVTGSRDGIVKVWDTRQKQKPVATIKPESGEVRDVWSVAIGNSYNDTERCVASGYENGDVKLFDLKAMKLIWETNVKNGVCAMEFDRKDIKMNKLVVSGLEATFNVFDIRTFHPKRGFANVQQKLNDNTTIWIANHLPQNRDIFITSGGNNSLNLYKYKYPTQRSVLKSEEDVPEGVAGTLQHLQTTIVAEQPINAFDWSPDKSGLCVFTSYDQNVRVGIVTKLNTL